MPLCEAGRLQETVRYVSSEVFVQGTDEHMMFHMLAEEMPPAHLGYIGHPHPHD